MNQQQRVYQVQTAIHQAAEACHRSPDDITLLAVSKGQDCESIRRVVAAGVLNIGESYWQEAKDKIETLKHLPICWHFIGPIQSNKAQDIARHFTWVHSLSRLKIAQLLNLARPAQLPPLQVCLQINFDAEPNKEGVCPDQLIQLATDVLCLPHLQLRGLMLIPKQETDPKRQYASFLRLTNTLHMLNQTLGTSMDTLSMGMSHDFKAAIRAGSTLVRIGTALFGSRTSREAS